MKNCYYINSIDPDKDKFLLALKNYFEKIATKNILLAVPLKSNLDGVIKEVFGEGFVKTLLKGNTVTASGFKFSLMTCRTGPQFSFQGAVLALYATKDLLDKIDNLRGVTDVLLIPWIKDDLSEWVPRWQAIDIETEQRAAGIQLSPEVKEKIDNLHAVVNVSTGLSHPSDRDYAIKLFKKMKEERISFNPGEIRNYLISEKKWNSTNADHVFEIADGIIKGKRFRTRS